MSCSDFGTTPPRRVLIVSLRFMGDLLISTLMADGVKQRWPGARVDYLVYEGMQGVLANNGCVDGVLTLPVGSHPKKRLGLLRDIWRRYDLALTSHSGDYPHLVMWAAAPVRAGALPMRRKHGWWKKRTAPLSVQEREHAPISDLCARIAAQAGITGPVRVRPPQAVTPWAAGEALRAAGQPYVVMNPCPRWPYKRWPREAWHTLVRALQARGLQVVLSGGHSAPEKAYVAETFGGLDGILVTDAGVGFAESATLIGGARLFIGPDTFTTHLAASCGVPTVTLFGPTDPRIWGPISRVVAGKPQATQPFDAVGAVQRRGNVWLLQNESLPCVPCQLEGCERHQQSASRCLDELPPEQVIAVVDAVLAAQPAAGSAAASATTA